MPLSTWAALAACAAVSVAVADAAAAPSSGSLRLSLDLGAAPVPLPHVWEATGWCPPDSQASPEDTHAFATQEASWQNHAFIAAVPNKGIKYVRIHNLLNMVFLAEGRRDPAAIGHPLPSAAYNFSLLDSLLDMVVREHGLRLGFEIMGNPRATATSRTGVYTSWADDRQIEGWRTLVTTVARRYISRYGVDEVSLWRWESWNEPNHNCNPRGKMKAGIYCDMPSWLAYWDACTDGLAAATPPGEHLTWGGPGAGGKMWSATTEWQLPAFLDHLKAKKAKTGAYGCDFLAWHNKGALPTGGQPSNTEEDLNSTARILEGWPGIATTLPMGNEEVDALGGWNHIEDWHGDAGNAAAIARILAMHEDLITLGGGWAPTNVSWGYHANDNAFLNYGDAWFSQRTLVARFEMNRTNTVEVIRKPTLNTMAMLSLLGDRRHRLSWAGVPPGAPQPQPAAPTGAPYGAIATSRGGAMPSQDPPSEVSVLLWNSNGTFNCSSDCSVDLDVTLPWGPAQADLRASAGIAGGTAVRVYRLDEAHGNPAGLFMRQSSGDPKSHPYPSEEEFAALRKESVLPSSACEGASVDQDAFCSLSGDPRGNINVSVHLPQPSVVLLHVCFPAAASSSLPVPGGLKVRTTTTPAQAFVRWNDVPSRCVHTYKVLYSPAAGEPFVPVANQSTIVTATVHQQATPARGFAQGCYKVGWVDYWGAASAYSDAVCVQGKGLPRPFVNL